MSDARPLSHMQQAMLVQEALSGCPMYTMPVCFSLRGRVDAGALEQALHQVMGRHPVLSCTYDSDVAQPCRRLPGLERVTSAAELDGLWDTLFDLTTGPPVRAMLASRKGSPSQEHALGLAVHHVAGDSWSLALMLRELGAAYAGAVSGSRADLPAAPDFFDHAAWEREQDWDGRDGAWWRDRLRGIAIQPAPRAGPSHAGPSHAGPSHANRGLFSSADLELDSDDTRDIKAVAATNRVSPAAVLFTAVSTAVTTAVSTAVSTDAGLGAAGSRRESVVGLTAVIRDTGQLQATVGPLINTLPVRTSWTDGPGIEGCDLLAVHARSLDEALAHKQVPYPAILRAAGLPRGPGADPLVVHVVNFDTVIPDLPLPGVHATRRPIPPRWANLPALWEFAWGTVGNIRGALRTGTESFTTADASELADRFRLALRRVLLELR